MGKVGVEWLYRFAQEPKRMGRRYFIEDAAFLGMVAKEAWYSVSGKAPKG